MLFESEVKDSKSGGSTQNTNHIINLRVVADLVQTVNLSYNVPEYKVNVKFEEMNFFIKHTQVQEILYLVDFFNDYQFALKVEKDRFRLKTIKPNFDKLHKLKDAEDSKDRIQIYQSCWVYYINRFIVDKLRKQYIEFYLKSLEKKLPLRAILTYREFQTLKNIVLRNSLEDLQDWTQTAYEIKERTKNIKMGNQSSRWKFWKSGIQGYQQIQEDQLKLRKLIE